MMSKENKEEHNRRLAKFYVTVARELAVAEKTYAQSDTLDSLTKRRRCLIAIASTAKLPLVRQFRHQQANKMAIFAKERLQIVEDKIGRLEKQLQPKLI